MSATITLSAPCHGGAEQQRQHPNLFTDDTTIAESLDMDIEEVRALLDEAKTRGLTQAANTFDGHAARLAGRGRLALDDIRLLQPQGGTSISGTFHGTILNVNSLLSEVTQTINASPQLDQSIRDELTKLMQRLQTELQAVPDDHAEQAEAVATYAKSLVETVTSEKPNKTTITITADGLKRAAETIRTVAPAVVQTATQIVEAIKQFLNG